MSVIEIKTSWDKPQKKGMYWAFSSFYNKWMICFYQNGRFYASGSLELGSVAIDTFNYPLSDVTKYKYIPEPKR